MEYYSAIKRNETELFVARWMDLESVMQSEVSQKEKNKYQIKTQTFHLLNFSLGHNFLCGLFKGLDLSSKPNCLGFSGNLDVSSNCIQ